MGVNWRVPAVMYDHCVNVFDPQMHRDKMVKEKKKKKKSKKNKKHGSDSSDSEGEEKKREKLKKVKLFLCLSVSLVWLISLTDWPPFCFLLPGTRSRGQACEAHRGTNASGREEEAVQQLVGSEGTHWGGDGGLPHETLPTRWSHGFLPGSMTSS